MTLYRSWWTHFYVDGVRIPDDHFETCLGSLRDVLPPAVHVGEIWTEAQEVHLFTPSATHWEWFKEIATAWARRNMAERWTAEQIKAWHEQGYITLITEGREFRIGHGHVVEEWRDGVLLGTFDAMDLLCGSWHGLTWRAEEASAVMAYDEARLSAKQFFPERERLAVDD